MSSKKEEEKTGIEETITITFGDAGENHAGMEMIGELLPPGSGLTCDNLKKIGGLFEDHPRIKSEYHSFSRESSEAGVLFLRNFLSFDEQLNLYRELVGFEWDEKYWDRRRGRVLNKRARSNVVIVNGRTQEPNYEEKKGRIVDGDKLPVYRKIKQRFVNRFSKIVGDKLKKLIGEGNRYKDPKKNGIGWHGDSERNIVIALRIGAKMAMHWQWFYEREPIGETFKFEVNGGDLYLMSEKAVGRDWKRWSIETLRHAAGAKKYLSLEKYKKKS